MTLHTHPTHYTYTSNMVMQVPMRHALIIVTMVTALFFLPQQCQYEEVPRYISRLEYD